MVRVAVKMLSFTFTFIVLHVLAHLGILCFGLSAIAEDNSVHGIACDDTFQLFKYCSFNGAGYFLALVTYFLLKTGEVARCRAAALAVLHSAGAVWGISTWYADLRDSNCETVYRDQYNMMWLYWNILVFANCFYGLMYTLHELVWARYSDVDLTVVPEEQSAADAKKEQAAKTYNWSAPPDLVEKSSHKGSEKVFPGQPVEFHAFSPNELNGTVGEHTPLNTPLPHRTDPLPPELGELLQAEYQKVVAGVNPSTPFKAEVDFDSDMRNADMSTTDLETSVETIFQGGIVDTQH